jgi:hypothetical protein
MEMFNVSKKYHYSIYRKITKEQKLLSIYAYFDASDEFANLYLKNLLLCVHNASSSRAITDDLLALLVELAHLQL